jgi:filamentous hemagglutinin family protein
MNRVNQYPKLRPARGAFLSTAAMATALAVAPQAARAQAFQGTANVVTGSAAISTGANTTTIDVGSPETVINWTPTDLAGTGTIDFLPSGTTATFQSNGDFTVLNRILPEDTKGNPAARMVAFNGTVDSKLVGATTAGNVWFYTPTGFIIGPTAVMNVGGLVLTTDDIQFTPNDPSGIPGSIYGPGGVIQFRGPAGSTGLIDVQAGARLNAVGTTSYIAMVAPRIQQGGLVSADRSVGYVAAEQADLTINAGLFNISILAGTTDPNGIVHTGTTTGSASASALDAKTISFVAMPKSTALTMLLSGSIGYAPAVDATNDGSAVVLSAGYATDLPSAEVAGSLGNISIDNASFANPTRASASGTMAITGAAGPVSFASDASLYAQDAIDITLGASEQLSVGAFMNLNAGRSGTGGTIDITLGDKASLSITDYLFADASSSASILAGSPSLDASGGTIVLDANGGALSFQAAYVNAGANGFSDPLTGGNAVGGDISLLARNGGSITGAFINANATAYGGFSDANGGNAIGGTIALISQNGSLDFSSVTLDAEAVAGTGSALSGSATGGTATVFLSGGTYNWDDLSLYTDAFATYSAGGQGNSAAVAADAVTLTLANSATLNVANDINLSANAIATVDAPADSTAQAGGIAVDVGLGSSLSFANFNGDAQASIDLPFFAGVTPTSTPDATGGTIAFNAAGNVTGGSITLLADAAQLGASSSAGKATGGTIDLTVNNGALVSLDNGAGTASLLLDAGALGAVGASAANALGGSARLSLDDGSVAVAGSVNVSASGQWHQQSVFYSSGPDPLNGFAARGGTATVELLAGTAGTASLSATSLQVDASGDATTPTFNYINTIDGGPPDGTYGGPMFANGGDGTGGTAGLTVAAGTLDVGDVTVKAAGSGGIAEASFLSAPYQNGDGAGGTASIGITGGTTTLSDLVVDASGTGGGGSPAAGLEVPSELAALAGHGAGGSAMLTVGGGSFDSASIELDATGTGGAGTDHISGGAATDGGNGTGGTATLVTSAGGTGQLASSNVLILAGGSGGAGGTSSGGTSGNGGDGIGGAAGAQLADGAFTLGPVTLGADGTGGDGVFGGRGTGGSANFDLVDSSGPSGARAVGSVSLFANGIAGSGTSAAGTSDAGSTGLTVDVASAAAALAINGDLTAQANGTNAAAGNGFAATVSGATLGILGNADIATSRDATITANSPLSIAGSLTVSARAFAETGSTQAGSAAITAPQGISIQHLGSNGTTSLLAANGAVTAAELISAGDVTAQARSISIASPGPLSIAGAQATAGDLAITTGGDLTLQSASATGAVSLASAGGAISATGPVSSGGAFAGSGRDGVSFGTLTSSGTTNLNSANGAVSVTDLNSAGLVTASGVSLDITSTGALAFGSAAATGGELNLTALSLAASGPLSSTGNTSITGANGISLASLTSGGTTDLVALNGPISVTDLRSSGFVAAFGRSIDIASGAGLDFSDAVASAGDVSLGTQGDLSTGTTTATGDVSLTSATGDVHTIGHTGGTAVTLDAAGNVQVDGSLDATGALLVSAGGTFGLTATAQGSSIAVTSSDVDLTGNANLGARGTTGDITLTNSTTTGTGHIGGAGSAGGYDLDAAEAARLFADNSVTLAGSSDVVIGDLALTFGAAGNIGTGGRLKVTTPANVEVSGAVNLATSSDADTFSIDPSRIDVIAGEGSIVMGSGSAAPQGTLDLTAAIVTVLSRSKLDAIAGLSDLAQISRVIGEPDGQGATAATLQAGVIQIGIDDALLIGNGGASDAFADRRGFSANELLITTGSPNTQIALNGVVVQNGVSVTGLDTAPLVTINDEPAAAGGQFDPLSTINGCVIGADCTLPPPPSHEVDFTNPTDDDLTQPLEHGDGTTGSQGNPVFVDDLFALGENAPLITPPLVDEPITGVGNDDLWVRGCSADDDGKCKDTKEQGE